ncbi:LPS export ABC transporter periplasmic protein LptC [Parvularcula sp. ZS-1/3]|uniref:LPS export ABC transporter periplasmic protein LptC n=1 Tax=Parvularcula mediterranea TaxID=2732508 RepID=A0A7Y3RMH8_9PROT|nr:LPS export ABC transporter periplasmic protein LptC [Parvularcula mediterranea]NNU15987.1 LPS export ABC transporter periplasmic protein LptC [Parvularcula mediterranea]
MPRRADYPELSDTALRVTQHTALVRHLRLAVPALAVGLVITYAMSATPPRIDREFLNQFSTIEETEGEDVRLASPRYAGEDLDGMPFEMAATTARRSVDNPDRIGLDMPEARRVRQDGQATLVRAKDGLYDQAGRTVDLSNGVELEQQGDNGTFLLETDAAELDLETQTVTSVTEVRGTGQSGTVRADRGTFFQSEDRIVLEGDVKITLDPQKKKKEGEAKEAEPETDKKN